MGGGISNTQQAAGIALRNQTTPGTPPVSPTGWADLTIIGGWAADTETPQYRVDSNGSVWLRGRIIGGPWAGALTTIANLPAGFMPPALRIFSVATFAGGGPTWEAGIMQVESAGAVDVVR